MEGIIFHGTHHLSFLPNWKVMGKKRELHMNLISFPSFLPCKPNTMKENYSPFPFHALPLSSPLPLSFAKHGVRAVGR